MYADIKERWYNALHSGKYIQTRERLCVETVPGSGEVGYCCLGVLCELYAKEYSIEWSQCGELDDGRKVWAFRNEIGFLPMEVIKWAGITGPMSHNPLLGRNSNKYTATEWNDNISANFATIAELIDMFIPVTDREEGESIDTYDE